MAYLSKRLSKPARYSHDRANRCDNWPGPRRCSRSLTRLEVRLFRPGFTLIEILVVIVVLAILSSIVAPNVFRHIRSAKDAAARSQIEMLGAALDAYRLDLGRYPSTDEGLTSLTTPPAKPRTGSWRGPYLRKSVPLDPWNNPYVYKSPGVANPNGYDLLSLGANGAPGGEGENADITSWK